MGVLQRFDYKGLNDQGPLGNINAGCEPFRVVQWLTDVAFLIVRLMPEDQYTDTQAQETPVSVYISLLQAAAQSCANKMA